MLKLLNERKVANSSNEIIYIQINEIDKYENYTFQLKIVEIFEIKA